MAERDTEEDWLATPDGHELYTKTWKPSTLKARLVFIHGFSDHCNFYPELFQTLAQQGIKVYSFDQRGWGKSVHEPKQKGLSGDNRQVMADITTFLKSLPAAEGEIPLFLMGHSMGGGEVAYYAATGPKETLSAIRGFLLESPLIAMGSSARPWKAKVVLGRIASKIMPHMPLVNKLNPNDVSRDPDVCKAFDADPLCHDTGTLETLAAMLDRSSELEEDRVVVKEGVGEGGKTRIWVGHGTADQLCSYDVCRQWFERLKLEDKEFRVYEGWYHKLHSEPGEDKFQFANDAAKWILDRSGPLTDVQSESPRSKL